MPTQMWSYLRTVTAGCVAVVPISIVAQTTPSATPNQVVLGQIAAYNHHDASAMFAVQTQDAGVYDLPDSVGVHSRDSVSNEFADFFTKNPQVNTQVLAHAEVGDFVMDRLHITGMATEPASQLIVIWQVKNGRVVNVWQTPFVADSVRPGDASAVVKRLTDAVDRHDWDAVASNFADAFTYHVLGDTRIMHQTRSELRANFAATSKQMPHLKHTVVTEMVVGPFVVQHERLTGKPNGKTADAVDVTQIQDGHAVAEWESPW